MSTISTFFRHHYDRLIGRHIRYWKRGRDLENKMGDAFIEAYAVAFSGALGEVLGNAMKKDMAKTISNDPAVKELIK